MHKTFFAGCDVSKSSIDACLLLEDGRRLRKRFTNSPEGHQRLIDWLTISSASVRLVVEATGNYSLDLALAVHAACDVELMVANPSATRQFAGGGP